MSPNRPRYLELLRVLVEHEVRFVVVGGVAAILEGVPMTTLDLDIVCERSRGNLGRLLESLRSIEAVYRDPAGRRIEPTEERLSTLKIQLFRTSLGPFDVLQSVGDLSWEELLRASKEREVGGLILRSLQLETLIECKKKANREKDRAVLPLMLETLEMRRRQGRS